jgi:hypothetical protein
MGDLMTGFVALAYEMEEIEGTRREVTIQLVKSGFVSMSWRSLTPVSWMGIDVVATHILWIDQDENLLAWQLLKPLKGRTDDVILGDVEQRRRQ